MAPGVDDTDLSGYDSDSEDPPSVALTATAGGRAVWWLLLAVAIAGAVLAMWWATPLLFEAAGSNSTPTQV